MARALVLSWHPTWEEAVAEALRVHRVCMTKFEGDPATWRYRVRRRRSGRHVLWRVYTPSGDLPRT